jgi:hypothetical protein
MMQIGHRSVSSCLGSHRFSAFPSSVFVPILRFHCMCRRFAYLLCVRGAYRREYRDGTENRSQDLDDDTAYKWS